ncbi:MAG: hypothetical protein ACPL07_04510, partial [Candidatus Bathyarchaeia archaeon]
VDLLLYMDKHGWCVPWDKGFISDITPNGNVSDVADLYRSRRFQDRVGTIYAAIYSLWKKKPSLAQKIADMYDWDKVPYNGEDGLWCGVYLFSLSCKIIDVWDEKHPDRKYTKEMGYKYIRNILIRARNCAGVEDKKNGNRITRKYIRIFDQTNRR